jgi:predicted transcriptional regulator
MKHVLRLPVSRIWKEYGAAACVSKAEVEAYFSGLREGYVILLEEARPVQSSANNARPVQPIRHCSPAILSLRYWRLYCVA